MKLLITVFWLVPVITWAKEHEGYDPTGGVSEENKLKIDDLYKAPSCSMETQEHDEIFWHYKGMLLDGKVFDEGNFKARLGHHDVITGVDKGMRGLCVGDKRRMTIHNEWAYGERGVPGKIPPKSTLIFDVELLAIERPGVGKVTKDDIIHSGGEHKEQVQENNSGVSKENKLKIQHLHDVDSQLCNTETEINDTITYSFEGFFINGTAFHHGNYTHTIGQNEVIVGIEKGLLNMCVGDERELTIHSDWGFGEDGIKDLVPPHTDLIYNIQLLMIKKPDGRIVNIDDIMDLTKTLDDDYENSDKLKIEDTFKSGKCSLVSRKGDTINWYYKGLLLDGTVFDEGTFDATIGRHHVITGVDIGMRGMCVGDKRTMTIHPDWAYGDQGTGGIPPKATLIFEVQLLKIERPNGKTARHYPIDPNTGMTEGQLLKIDIIHEVDNCIIRSQKDDTIHFYYKGIYLDGTEFYSGNINATLGNDQLITGLDKGMRGVCVGEKRRLTIHPDWAYGDEGRDGAILPKATLIFDVEMQKIERPDPIKSEL